MDKMNTRAEIALDDFMVKFDEFLIACSELESSGRWDVDKHGPMSAYFETDLFAVVLQIMSADGVFERPETEVLNRMFSAEYTQRELFEIYKSIKPVVDGYCEKQARDAIKILRSVDEGLCDVYRELILDACDIVSASDGVAEDEERFLIAKLRIALEK